MSGAKWIKIAADTFDDEKMLRIESMPNADAIIVTWFKLLCMAGKNNNGGVLMFTNRVAYNEDMLSVVLREPKDIIHQALTTFIGLGMIDVDDGVISITNWNRDRICEDKQQFRFTTEYKKWRESVFSRDDYTCQRCGRRGGRLNAHHIMPYAYYPKLRYVLGNGIALCEQCHKLAHKKGAVQCRTE